MMSSPSPPSSLASRLNASKEKVTPDAAEKGSIRYAMQLDDVAVQHLERLRATYRLKSKADVYELSVRILTWATEQTVNGFEVGRCRDGQFHPLLIPYEADAQTWSQLKPESN